MNRTILTAIAAIALALFVVFGVDWSGGRSADVPDSGPGSAETASTAGARQSGGSAERAPSDEPVRDDRGSTGGRVPVEIPDDENDSIARLTGRVLRAVDDEPIAGAIVSLLVREADQFWTLDLDYGQGTETVESVESDAEGRFAFSVEPDRVFRLRVEAEGFAPEVVLRCSGGRDLVVRLGPGAAVEGTVVLDGEPIAEVPLRIAVEGTSLELATGQSGLGGRFRFDGLQAATVFVQAQPTFAEESWERVTLVAGETAQVRVELSLGRTIRGRVVELGTNVPIPDAEVSDSWVFRRVVRSGPDGWFTLEGMSGSGEASVYARAVGYARGVLDATERTEDEEIVIALDRGGRARVRVVDSAGNPIPDAYVAFAASFMVRAGNQTTDWITADHLGEGVFTVGRLDPDVGYQVMARRRGFGTRIYALPRSVASGQELQMADLVLLPEGGIAGRVLDDRGEPVPGVSISIRGSNGDWLARSGGARAEEVYQFTSRSAVSGDDGRFRAVGLSAGSYALTVRADAYLEVDPVRVEVRDGEIDDSVSIALQRAVTISGHIAFDDGQPYDHIEHGRIRVHAFNEDSWISEYAEVDEDGRFEISGLASGLDYILTLFAPPTGFAMSPRRGVSSGAEDVRLLLGRASTIEGRVVDEAGQGTRARLVLSYRERVRAGSPFHWTDDDGNFRIEVPHDFDGAIRALHATSPITQSEGTEVRAGQRDVVLTLPE